jgi:hypothetical protein
MTEANRSSSTSEISNKEESSSFWLALFQATSIYTLIQGLVFDPQLGSILTAIFSEYVLNNINAFAVMLSLLVFVLSLSASSKRGQHSRNSGIERLGQIVVFMVAIFIFSRYDFRDYLPSPGPSQIPLPTVTISPTDVLVTEQAQIQTVMAPIGLNDMQRQDVLEIIRDYLDGLPNSRDVQPGELLDMLRQQFRDEYGFGLDEVQFCLVGPIADNSSVSIRPQAYVNPNQNPREFMYPNDVALAIAHSGGEVNTDLWWFVRYIDSDEREIVGWVASSAVEELTLGCELMRRNLPAYLGVDG